MNNPLHAKYYADQAVVSVDAAIVENTALARDTWRLRIACPELASRIAPGQFVMVRIHDCDDPLIGRPLALYDIYRDRNGQVAGIDVVYLVKGKLTSQLVKMATGQALDVWGPLGNGFAPRRVPHLVMVAGGIGQTPFLAMAKQWLGREVYALAPDGDAQQFADRVTLCYGARTADLLAGVDDFRQAGIDVRICTDDGTSGRHGLVTEELTAVLSENQPNDVHVVCCGPEPMMEAAAAVTAKHGVSCEVSWETPMACGIGICFSCVAPIKQDDGTWDYKRTCVDGPVFAADCIDWNADR